MELPVIDNCEGCGVCCMHMAVPPYDDEEIELLQAGCPEVYADYLRAVEYRELQLKVSNVDWSACGFFDALTRQCRHHDHSPDVCHRFEVGGEFCRQQRRDAGLPA